MLRTAARRAAGRSASKRFKALVRPWRKRLWPATLVCSLLFTVFAVVGTLVSSMAQLFLGVLTGAVMAMYLALRESPPHRIEKWRIGAEGEQRTAKALGSLPRNRWRIWHDRDGGQGTNIDHVVVSDAGVFLLDTKNYSGEATVQNGELTVQWPEDPEEGWTTRRLFPRMRGAAADLNSRICSSTDSRRPWIEPVVVLWMKFPQSIVRDSGVVFVRGDLLTDWLSSQPPSGRPIDVDAIGRFLESIPASGS